MYTSGLSMGIMRISDSANNNDLSTCLEQLVKEVNDTELTIYSYVGDEKHEPIYYEEIDLFKKMLVKANLNCPVVEVSDDEFSAQDWDPKTSLLHIPGAISSELDLHLGTKVGDIQEFVNKGGKFLGWCGGGYWACREVQYRVDDMTMLHKIRDLAFWKGMEKGPLLPFLGNPTGNIGFFHGAVKVHWSGSETLKKYLPQGLELNVLLSGGGSFIPDNQEHCYKVIATYCDIEKARKFAGVKTYIGDGIAILINPYFTHGADYLRRGLEEYEKYFPEHKWSKIVADLEGEDLKSTICFVDMLLEATQKPKLD
jgi:glutamine amidotransferase-like uncharacterized protein